MVRDINIGYVTRVLSNRKQNKVIELYFGPRNSTPLMRDIDSTLEGFLILDDAFISAHDVAIVNTTTGKRHKIIEHAEYKQTSFKNEIYGGANCGSTNTHNTYTLLKVEDQHEINVGDFVYRILPNE